MPRIDDKGLTSRVEKVSAQLTSAKSKSENPNDKDVRSKSKMLKRAQRALKLEIARQPKSTGKKKEEEAPAAEEKPAEE